MAQCADLDNQTKSSWYGLSFAGLNCFLWTITVGYTFKLKKILRTMKTFSLNIQAHTKKYSQKIPDNVMKICYAYSLATCLFMIMVVTFPQNKVFFNSVGDLISSLYSPLLLRFAVTKNQVNPEQINSLNCQENLEMRNINLNDNTASTVLNESNEKIARHSPKLEKSFAMKIIIKKCSSDPQIHPIHHV